MNPYLAALRAEYHEYRLTRPDRASAAAGQIRKIIGPMSEAQQARYFAPEPVESEPADGPAA